MYIYIYICIFIFIYSGVANLGGGRAVVAGQKGIRSVIYIYIYTHIHTYMYIYIYICYCYCRYIMVITINGHRGTVYYDYCRKREYGQSLLSVLSLSLYYDYYYY